MYGRLTDSLFSVDAAAAVGWSQKVLLANLTYFRVRRELFEEFVAMTSPVDGTTRFGLSHESFIVIRQFLTARNDAINDDKRLSFDKAILQLRADAQAAVARAPVRAAGLAGLLGMSSSAPTS